VNVVRMDRMFQGATAFNQDIGSWQTANLVLIENMFDGATAFNQDLRGWYVKLDLSRFDAAPLIVFTATKEGV